MQDMPSSSSTIRALMFGDQEVLCEAIKMGVRQHFEVAFAEPPPLGVGPQGNHQIEDLDLVTVTNLSAEIVPIELLTRVSLDRMLGKTPLLVIAEERRELGLEAGKGFRLDFPFECDELHSKAAEILSYAPECAGARRPHGRQGQDPRCGR